MSRLWRLSLVGFLLAISTPAFLGAQSIRPEQQIDAVFHSIVDDVEAQRQSIEQDLCIAYSLVDKHLRGQFDWFFTSRHILGANWPSGAETQSRFVDAFYDHLVAGYGDLLIHFNSETFEITGFDADPPPESTFLQMLVTMNDGDKVPFDLRMRVIDGAWHIIDVKPETFSYVRDFHANFRAEIFDVGLDGLIARLEEEAAPRRACGE